MLFQHTNSSSPNISNYLTYAFAFISFFEWFHYFSLSLLILTMIYADVMYSMLWTELIIHRRFQVYLENYNSLHKKAVFFSSLNLSRSKLHTPSIVYFYGVLKKKFFFPLKPINIFKKFIILLSSTNNKVYLSHVQMISKNVGKKNIAIFRRIFWTINKIRIYLKRD